MNRRKFLKSGVVAAVGFPTIVPSSVLGNEGLPAPSNRIVMGSIGLGGMGKNNMKNFLGKNEVQYVAVCDVDKSHLREAKGLVDESYGNKSCRTYSDYRELIQQENIDAVCISVPDHWHAKTAVDCAKAGIDIYGEKPLTHNLREGRVLCDTVKRYGRVWQTGSWQRSHSSFHHACELVRNGRIGRVRKVEVGVPPGVSHFREENGRPDVAPPPSWLDYDFWLGPAPWSPYCKDRVHFNWRWNLDYGGGQLMDWIGHHGDIAHWGLGLDYSGPLEIKGKGTFENRGIWNAPTGVKIDYKYENGVRLVVSSSVPMGTKWYGENGWVFVSRNGLSAEHSEVLKEKISSNEIRLYKSTDHWQNFIDCVKSRRETATPCEVAHRSASIGHLGLVSILTGRKIEWDPETEKIKDDDAASRLLSRTAREPWGV